MQYFESLPKIIYTDDSGIPKIATNPRGLSAINNIATIPIKPRGTTLNTKITR